MGFTETRPFLKANWNYLQCLELYWERKNYRPTPWCHHCYIKLESKLKSRFSKNVHQKWWTCIKETLVPSWDLLPNCRVTLQLHMQFDSFTSPGNVNRVPTDSACPLLGWPSDHIQLFACKQLLMFSCHYFPGQVFVPTGYELEKHSPKTPTSIYSREPNTNLSCTNHCWLGPR